MAALTGAIIGGAAALGGAGIGALSQGAATGAAVSAQEKALAEQKKQHEEAMKLLAPLAQQQTAANQQLFDLAQPGSAAEQAARSQGTAAVQRQLAAQGLLRSGAQGDQLANLELGLIQNRQNILAQIAGSGALQNQAGLLSQFGAAQGSGIANIGQTAAQGGLQQAAILNNGLQGVANAFAPKQDILSQLALLQGLGAPGGSAFQQSQQLDPSAIANALKGFNVGGYLKGGSGLLGG